MKTGAVVGIQDMGAAGLACCTSEMPARAGTGMDVELSRVPQREVGMTPYEILLSESQERMLLVAGRGREDAVRRIFAKWELDAVEIGRVTAGNGRHVFLDPRRGAAMAVCEAARNVSCSGATPVGVTDCMNFGSPERPEIRWQFAQAIDGIAEACRALEIPVVGGNVSFYN